MNEILATLPDASAISLERVWRLALMQELGLVIDAEGLEVLSVQTYMYSIRAKMLEADPSLPLLDFYITMPKDMNLIVIVREPKAQLE